MEAIACSGDDSMSTGCYYESGLLIEYTIIYIDSDSDYRAEYEKMLKRPMKEGETAIAVLKSEEDVSSIIGFISYGLEDGIDKVDDIDIVAKQLDQVCLLDPRLCSYCTDSMGRDVLRDNCCHFGYGVNYIPSKCICVSEELMNQIQNHNAMHGNESLIMVKDKLKNPKRVSAQMESSSSASTCNENDMYCICNSLYDEDRSMVECSNGDQCRFNGWLHLDCLGLKEKDLPENDYYCPSCTKNMREASIKKEKLDVDDYGMVE